jgi:uncharacterized protein YodC (DUF2158 family)
MSENKYSIGDIVKLNAGGPDMSILGFGARALKEGFQGTYKCQWFAGKKLEHGLFTEESLLKVVDSDEG